MSEPHGATTGTVAFIATEVASMEHHRLELLRLPRLVVSRKTIDSLVKSDRDDLPLEPQPFSSEPPRLPPFRHNPLHDMESVWWLCVWMMFYLSYSKERSWEQFQNYYRIFGSQAAKKDFSELSKFKQLTNHLSGTPAFVSTIYSWLMALNSFYSDCYEQQDSLANPPTILQVDDDTIELFYNYGRKALRTLEKGSEPLPECVKLSERRQQENSRKTPRLISNGVNLPLPKKRRTQ
ncbi:unnamed protein product [Rhizoctonia solani]|uniref:Fungal-type protein kinase domain-containing protein n=1 Tax=Rhizoctonia solani TaxID=456999 RepID=A0A8H3HGH3_9AGAM|nr:unnamed protein product [Rhizoctonia solani]